MLSEERNKAMTESKTNNIMDCKGMSSEWITNEIWDDLVDTVWGTEERKNKSRKGRQNRLTPKERSIPKHTGGSVPFVVYAKKMAIEMKRNVSFLEVFNRTHKRMVGHGDFIDNKSKSTSKYGEDSSFQPEFDPHAWIEATERMETTRTHVYGFGTWVPVTALLSGTQSNVVTSESTCGPINSNATNLAIALEEKLKNLSKNLGKIREEIRGEIHEEIKNAMTKSMSKFMAHMETMIVTTALSKHGNAGTSSSNLDK
ncbi:PREDICTED: uncharacterized protein LOC108663353 [Theobroma cacao]|uniref:Uncharacterized protein LOC108663353 n=1 Tax=Theobroma cacao TaxID=3641 RepID=A0AB32WWZ8_THECC|nr:PREDICTED: uncharacterized protein LOC108663353 [Theobroma cacao]